MALRFDAGFRAISTTYANSLTVFNTAFAGAFGARRLPLRDALLALLSNGFSRISQRALPRSLVGPPP
jgi:hypothetical protein